MKNQGIGYIPRFTHAQLSSPIRVPRLVLTPFSFSILASGVHVLVQLSSQWDMHSNSTLGTSEMLRRIEITRQSFNFIHCSEVGRPAVTQLTLAHNEVN